MSDASTNIVEQVQAYAQALAPQIDRLFRGEQEQVEVVELRSSGVSERQIRALYPLSFAYPEQINELLTPGTWLAPVLRELKAFDRCSHLPERLNDPVAHFDPEHSRFVQYGWMVSVRDELNYLCAFVTLLASEDLSRDAKLVHTSLVNSRVEKEWVEVNFSISAIETALDRIEHKLNRAPLSRRLRRLLRLA